jgi:two-component system cell cycle sensor histidine kinase/response regulator CckA
MQRRVLVADDDGPTLAMVAEVLERMGNRVCRAEDGNELLQAIAEQGPFDLVVTDISMPWMTGLQVAHSARSAGLATPVLVMTALPIEANTVDALGDQTMLLRKPFGIKQLTEAVNQLLP